MSNIKLVTANALDFLKRIPDRSVGLVLIDPPWNISRKRYGNTYGWDTRKVESFFEWITHIFRECYRVLQPRRSLLVETGYSWLCKWISAAKDVKLEFKQPIILYLTNGIGRRSFVGWSSYSLCLWFGKKAFDGKSAKVLKKYKDVIAWSLVSNKNEPWSYPNPKSVDAYATLIRMFSLKDDLVVDCFLGSGTTALACKRENRKFLGCDINPEYVKIANWRLQHTQSTNQH